MDEPKRSMTREELHELVWTTPMQKLAEIYALSDRGMAKICERYLVPVPPRGYWAKVEAGQAVRRTPLRAVENAALQHVHIGSRPTPVRSAYLEEVLATAKRETDSEGRHPERASEPLLPPSPISPPRAPEVDTTPSGKIHQDVRRFLSELRACKVDRDGFVYLKYVKVAPRDITRVGGVLSSLAFELGRHGFSFNDMSNRIGFTKDGTTVDLGIEAPRKRVTEVTQSGWKRFDYVHIGRLHLRIYGWADGIKKQWVDTDTKQVEQALGQMIESFLLNHVAEREREERLRQEEERRAHLARRRKMAELRNKRETDRLEYLQWIADTRREVADLSETIALVPQVADLPKAYQRMMEWARTRLQSLQDQTTIERIQATLEERELYADPDPLDDPEGDPPPKINSWDD